MNTPSFVLQNLCISVSSLQGGFADQIVEEASLRLQQCSFRDENSILKIVNKMLPTVKDSRFSPLWVVLLDKISTLRHEDNDKFYSRMHEILESYFPEDNLPLPVLHHLWLGHLPSLEFSVLTLVKHLSSSQQYTNSTITKAIKQSQLAIVGWKEPLIYLTVCNMMESLIAQSNFSSFLIDLQAIYSQMTRRNISTSTLQQQMRITTTWSHSLYEIETLLWTHCDNISPKSVLSTLQRIYEIWMKMQEPFIKSDEKMTDSKKLYMYKELWYLTVVYKEWMVAALNQILFCDHQYVELCLWIIACHHRMQLEASDFEMAKLELNNFVNSLRSLMVFTHDLKLELQPLLISQNSSLQTLATSCSSSLLSKDDFVVQCRQVKNQLLATFLIHSAAGFPIGREILKNVTGSDTAVSQACCFVNHYQLLETEPRLWHDEKLKQFAEFINDMRLQLEAEKDLEGNSNFFKKLQDDLKNLLSCCE